MFFIKSSFRVHVSTEPSLSVAVRFSRSSSSSRHASTQQYICLFGYFVATCGIAKGLLITVNVNDLFNKCVKVKIVFLMNSVSCVIMNVSF